MILTRPAHDRGQASHGWLDTRHTFSFAGYHDPQHMGFRSLRVMNEDRVSPGQGFGMHPHDNMEIISYVMSGALQHRDSMGNGAVLRPGEFQRITAGSGITHSEFNPSAVEPVHFYQIWIHPNERNTAPGYEQTEFDPAGRQGQLQLVASPDGRAGSLSIRQDVDIYLSAPAERELKHPLAADRHAWIQVLTGHVSVNGIDLQAGDGAAVSNKTELSIAGREGSGILLFDLA